MSLTEQHQARTQRHELSAASLCSQAEGHTGGSVNEDMMEQMIRVTFKILQQVIETQFETDRETNHQKQNITGQISNHRHHDNIQIHNT